MFLTVGDEDERLALVTLGQRADAVRAEEFVLVEHRTEYPTQLLLVEQREQDRPCLRRPLTVTTDGVGYGRVCAEKPERVVDHLRERATHSSVQHRRCRDRHQTHDRAHL